MRLRSLLFVSALVFISCGEPENAEPQPGAPVNESGIPPTGPSNQEPDPAPVEETETPDNGGLSTCDATGKAHAVVVAMSGADEVRVLTQRGGKLIDNGLKFTVSLPRRVAIRADGKEAVVAWGDVTKPYGVAVFSIAPDGSTASLVKNVTLGTNRSPWGVDYATDDRVVLTVAGPKHEVITLGRTSGTLAESGRANSPGNFPLELVRRPGHPEVILTRSEFGVDDVTYTHLMAENASGAFVSKGTVGSIDPQSTDVGVHPNGDLVYSLTADPKDTVSETELEMKGILQTFSVGTAGVAKKTTLSVARTGSVVAVDPLGRFIVTDGSDYTWDPNTQTPVIRSSTLQTFPLDAAGTPGPAAPESPLFPLLLVWDMAVSPSAHLVTSMNMFVGSVPEEKETPLEIRAQTSPGQWTVCQTILLPGGAKLAIAP